MTTGQRDVNHLGKGATEQQERNVSAKISERVDRIVEPEVYEYHANGAESTCLDVGDGSLEHTCETDVCAQELNDSSQIMELNESTLEHESENSNKSNSEPFLGAGRALETKWIAQ